MINPITSTFDVLIVANGQKPSRDLFKTLQKNAKKTLCCDGAANWLLKNNFDCDMVIGDLDSIHEAAREEFFTLKISEQSNNDLEKVISYCHGNGWRSLVVIGAFGKRADHFLTNLFVMRRFSKNASLIFVDDEQKLFLVPNEKTIYCDGIIGDFLSLFPLEASVGPITTLGLRYVLSEEYLSFESRLGTLNQLTKKRASITLKKGDLALCTPLSMNVTGA